MNNDENECLEDNYKNKYYVLKNTILDLSKKNIKQLLSNDNIKILNNKYYYKNKLIHKQDGPAVDFYRGTKFYITYGKLHRLDGPAIEHSYGDKEYWINGNRISEENFYLEKELRNNIVNINNNKLKKKI